MIKKISFVVLIFLFIFLIYDFELYRIILFIISSLLFYFESKYSLIIVTFVLYELLKILPNTYFFSPQVENIYNLEILLFGIEYNKEHLTVGQYFLKIKNIYLDTVAAFFYSLWCFIPLFVIKFCKSSEKINSFSAIFFYCSIFSFLLYYLLPVAPPWYFLNDCQIDDNYPGGFISIDQYFSIDFFSKIYKLNSNLFAAIPSLHVLFAYLSFRFVIKNNQDFQKNNKYIFFFFFFGIFMAAIYTQHHYIIDCIISVLIVEIFIMLNIC